MPASPASPATVALCIAVAACLLYALAWVRWWYRLDDVDRFAIRCARYNTELHACDYTSPSLLTKIARLALAMPFRPRDFFARATNGGMYSGYEPIRGNAALRRGMQDKLFWWRTFRRAGIPTPDVLAYTRGGRLIVLEEPRAATSYVQKPRRGGLGMHVVLVRGDVLRSRAAGEAAAPRYDYLVQRRLRDCTMAGRARHFRVVTLYNRATPFVTVEMVGRRGSLVSNNSQNGGASACRGHVCPDLAAEDQREVNALARRLAALHRAEFRTFFSIGWDIMLHCDGGDGARRVAHCLEGNIGHGTWQHPHNVDMRVVRAYKRRYRAFLCEHGLLDCPPPAFSRVAQ